VPASRTADGALDGISHPIEVQYFAVGKPNYEQVEGLALEEICLRVQYVPRVLSNPFQLISRQIRQFGFQKNLFAG
jgi:hypothetical protein